MRLKQRVGDNATKQIGYYGQMFMVPKSTTHVATDGDGQMYAYIGAPRYYNELDVWMATHWLALSPCSICRTRLHGQLVGRLNDHNPYLVAYRARIVHSYHHHLPGGIYHQQSPRYQAYGKKMKRVPRKHEKEMTYFGIDLIVPKYIKYVVVNPNGECEGYSSKPEFGKIEGGGMAWATATAFASHSCLFILNASILV